MPRPSGKSVRLTFGNGTLNTASPSNESGLRMMPLRPALKSPMNPKPLVTCVTSASPISRWSLRLMAWNSAFISRSAGLSANCGTSSTTMSTRVGSASSAISSVISLASSFASSGVTALRVHGT
ncbi:MAG: hypothetical protein K0Q52_3966 [Microbacterium sp.]|nr:hypothetical protein [Microbacterium sp.]